MVTAKASEGSTDGPAIDMDSVIELWRPIIGTHTTSDPDQVQVLREWRVDQQRQYPSGLTVDREEVITHYEGAMKKMRPWRATGPDSIHGFWWKTLPAVRKILGEIIAEWAVTGKVTTEWLCRGRTVLIPKEVNTNGAVQKLLGALRRANTLDVKVRQILKRNKCRFQASCVQRLYVPRERGGLGLRSVEDLLQDSILATEHIPRTISIATLASGMECAKFSLGAVIMHSGGVEAAHYSESWMVEECVGQMQLSLFIFSAYKAKLFASVFRHLCAKCPMNRASRCITAITGLVDTCPIYLSSIAGDPGNMARFSGTVFIEWNRLRYNAHAINKSFTIKHTICMQQRQYDVEKAPQEIGACPYGISFKSFVINDVPEK
ncbi:unnamed protein product, partial [Anisakis simplex]|uniref:C2H2-type domain-containing protein n=1 Tax=Anisakis simplex TaxID=6269 RepID=A0A0M3J5B9_ANISI